MPACCPYCHSRDCHDVWCLSAAVVVTGVCVLVLLLQVAASVEELSSVFVGSCSKFRVELLPQPAGAGPDSSTADAAAADAPAAPAGSAGPLAGVVAAAPAAPRPGRPTPVSATPAPPKTLMYFDGCTLPLGCTVLLRGAPAAELTKVKRVVKFGVLAAYHLSLEVNFLAEELALSTAALASSGMRSHSRHLSSHPAQLLTTLRPMLSEKERPQAYDAFTGQPLPLDYITACYGSLWMCQCASICCP